MSTRKNKSPDDSSNTPACHFSIAESCKKLGLKSIHFCNACSKNEDFCFIQKTAVKKPCERLWILPPDPTPRRIAVHNVLLDSYQEIFKTKQKVDNKDTRYSYITSPHEHRTSKRYKSSEIITPLLLPEKCKPRKNQKERIKVLEAQLEYAKRLTINLIISYYNQPTIFL